MVPITTVYKVCVRCVYFFFCVSSPYTVSAAQTNSRKSPNSTLKLSKRTTDSLSSLCTRNEV